MPRYFQPETSQPKTTSSSQSQAPDTQLTRSSYKTLCEVLQAQYRNNRDYPNQHSELERYRIIMLANHLQLRALSIMHPSELHDIFSIFSNSDTAHTTPQNSSLPSSGDDSTHEHNFAPNP